MAFPVSRGRRGGRGRNHDEGNQVDLEGDVQMEEAAAPLTSASTITAKAPAFVAARNDAKSFSVKSSPDIHPPTHGGSGTGKCAVGALGASSVAGVAGAAPTIAPSSSGGAFIFRGTDSNIAKQQLSTSISSKTRPLKQPGRNFSSLGSLIHVNNSSGQNNLDSVSGPGFATTSFASNPQSTVNMFKTGGAGLSINTGAANAGTPSTGGGLFGASTQNQPQQGQQSSGGGLFGSNTTQQTQQQQTGTGGGGLFGNATQQQKPAGGGGLFGGAASTTTPAQPQQSGGLFGGAQANNTQQTQQQNTGGGGLFGSAQQTTQNTATAGTGGGLFGQSQAQAKPSGGLFGASTAAASAPQQQQNSNAGLTMGQSTNQQSVPGVRIDLANLKGTTKFNDLTPELQKEIEACDDVIQTFKSQADQISQFRAGHKGDLERLTHDVEWLQRKFDGVKTTLEDDVKTVHNLKNLVKSDAEIAKAAFSGAEQLKLPAHYHTTWLTANKPAAKSKDKDEEPDLQDCITLFTKESERLDELHRFQVQKIKEMEMHMPGVENGLYERMTSLRDGAPQFAGFAYARQLLDVVKALGDEIVRSAGEIIEAREKLNQLQLRPLPTRK